MINFFKWAWLFFLQIMVLFFIYPSDWVHNATEQERLGLLQELGPDTHNFIINNANSMFNRTMIDSGFYQMLHDHVIPNEEQLARDAETGFAGFGKLWFDYLESRLESMFRLIYFMMVRYFHLLVWLPYALILLAPAVWDGYQQWRIKCNSFEYTSPTIHSYSFLAIKFMLAASIMVFLLPVALPVFLFPGLLLVIVFLSGITVSHFPKKVTGGV